MKKIIFVAGLLTGYTAAAQQNDLFDIEKHLEKKNKKNITLPPGPTIKFKKQDSTFISLPGQQATLSHILPNGNRVYLLPQGNMPCIVPDVQRFNMPLMRLDSLPGTMPNVWSFRHKIIPE